MSGFNAPDLKNDHQKGFYLVWHGEEYPVNHNLPSDDDAQNSIFRVAHRIVEQNPGWSRRKAWEFATLEDRIGSANMADQWKGDLPCLDGYDWGKPQTKWMTSKYWEQAFAERKSHLLSEVCLQEPDNYLSPYLAEIVWQLSVVRYCIKTLECWGGREEYFLWLQQELSRKDIDRKAVFVYLENAKKLLLAAQSHDSQGK